MSDTSSDPEPPEQSSPSRLHSIQPIRRQPTRKRALSEMGPIRTPRELETKRAVTFAGFQAAAEESTDESADKSAVEYTESGDVYHPGNCHGEYHGDYLQRMYDVRNGDYGVTIRLKDGATLQQLGVEAEMMGTRFKRGSTRAEARRKKKEAKKKEPIKKADAGTIFGLNKKVGWKPRSKMSTHELNEQKKVLMGVELGRPALRRKGAVPDLKAPSPTAEETKSRVAVREKCCKEPVVQKIEDYYLCLNPKCNLISFEGMGREDETAHEHTTITMDGALKGGHLKSETHPSSSATGETQYKCCTTPNVHFDYGFAYGDNCDQAITSVPKQPSSPASGETPLIWCCKSPDLHTHDDITYCYNCGRDDATDSGEVMFGETSFSATGETRYNCCSSPNVTSSDGETLCHNCGKVFEELFTGDVDFGFDYSANSLASPMVLPRLNSANHGSVAQSTMEGTFPVAHLTMFGLYSTMSSFFEPGEEQTLSVSDRTRSASKLPRLPALPRLVRAHSAPPASTANTVSKTKKKKQSRAAKNGLKRIAARGQPLPPWESQDFSFGDFTIGDFEEVAHSSSRSTNMGSRDGLTAVLELVDKGGYKNPTTESLDRFPRERLCYNCRETGQYEDECPLCLRCKSADHKTSDCEVGIPKFIKFMELPLELRERIYEYALASDHPINPHMCDSSKDSGTGAPGVKFHDDNQHDHGAVTKLLGVTRVNKQIREESFKIFYSANAFVVGMDTTTYFARLEHLGRFKLIRHVCFGIEMHSVNKAPSFLRRMNQYIKEEAAYEKSLRGAPVGANYNSLVAHPQYNCGGITELNMLIALRKLTSSLTTDKEGKGKAIANATYTSKIVFPVPSVEAFNAYERLRWFATTLYGLGISLHYVEGHPLDYNYNSVVGITWQQRFQKKDFEYKKDNRYVSPVGNDGQTEAYRRALALNPALERQPRASGYAYMRTDCRGAVKEWRKMANEGGGIMGPSGLWE
jgi:hypothetical protein